MSDSGDIEWRVSDGLTPYDEALAAMEARAAAVREGNARELVWLLEHPPLFTAGTSADPAELFNPLGFPVYEAGRGGRYTYHGPGQRVGYLILDLDRRGVTLHGFSINVAPDLSHFGGIIPCGIADFGVTSLARLGLDQAGNALDSALCDNFPRFVSDLSPSQQVA